MADQELEANMGMPAIYSVCEGIRTWLLDNNQEYDGSMYAQMMRKQEAASKAKEDSTVQYESHNMDKKKIPTEAELEEAAVYKRRQEGTPCNRENFDVWKEKFDKEMEEKTLTAEAKEKDDSKKKKDKSKDKKEDNKPSGYEIFGSKSGVLDLEAMEAAADMETLNVDDVDEDLFVDEDSDEDLDDMDFDDDSDDEEDEPDI